MPNKPRGKRTGSVKAQPSPRRPVSPEPRIRDIGLDEFVRRLRADTNAEKYFAIFLGSGCSVTSGIPSAGALVRDRWIPRLRDYEAPDRSDLDTFATEVIPGFNVKTPATSYGALIDRLFLTPEDRQREIEDLCDGRTPSFGYAVMAQLVAQPGGRFNVVLTTNFDDLIADALYLYTDARPLVIYHESLAAFIRPTRKRPLVVKLHGDHRLSPRNTALETQSLEQEIQRHTAMVLHDRGIIFMGYGGADVGILQLLNELPREALPYGAYWVHPSEPKGLVREWLSSRQGVWVRSGWFDEVMLLIRNEFDLPHPSGERFTRIFQEYHQKFQALSDSIDEKPSGEAGIEALKKALVDTEARFPDYWKVISEAIRVQRQDPQSADRIFRDGLLQFPRVSPLLGNYANFLSDILKDHNAAEEMYKEALEADPQDANTAGNYALFLRNVRNDPDAANSMFRRTLEIDSKHANNLSNYAGFLTEVRKDHDTAETMYKRSLEAEPNRASALGSYAVFLKNVRRDNDAAETMYKRALEAEPNRPSTLGNYALFLKNNRKDYDKAERMYERALDADPTNATTLSNYAVFLNTVRNDNEGAEKLFQRALEADPKHAPNIGNYAHFLSDTQKDYDRAEAMYKRALEVDPANTTNLGNYAHFLSEIRGDNDSAESMYEVALKTEPRDSNTLANLAGLLLADGRRDGLPVLDRALAAFREQPLPEAELECAFYLYAHGSAHRRADALRIAKTLIDQGVRSPGWDLSRNTARASVDGHPDASRLSQFAAVINGDTPPDALNDWPEWQGAAS